MSLCRIIGLSALLLAALAGPTSSPALARNRDNSFEFGVFGGSMMFDTPVLFALGGRGDSGSLLGTRDSEFFGARLGYNFTPHWEVELTHDDTSSEDRGFRTAQRDFVSDHIAVNYNFLTTTEQRIYPYVAGGLGRIVNKITVLGDATEDTSSLWAVGGGFRLFFNKNVSLRIDGRFKTYTQKFDIPDPDGPAREDVPPVLIDDTFSTFELTFGLFGIMGGKK